MKTIREKRAAIALFMGMEVEQTPKGMTLFINEKPDGTEEYIHINDLMYDRCWNWLMPALEKVMNTGASSNFMAVFSDALGLGLWTILVIQAVLVLIAAKRMISRLWAKNGNKAKQIDV